MRRLWGVELAAEVARRLRGLGFYAARHSTSILVMAEGRVVGSIHVYGDECILRAYRPYLEANASYLDVLGEELEGLCGRVRSEEGQALVFSRSA